MSGAVWSGDVWVREIQFESHVKKNKLQNKKKWQKAVAESNDYSGYAE